MIRYGQRLVLSELDMRRWTRITGFEPMGVETWDDLEAYVCDCKRYYAEASEDAAFLCWLMDVELERYGAKPAADAPRRLCLVSEDPGREALECELLWNIALDGDAARREELKRLLAEPSGRP